MNKTLTTLALLVIFQISFAQNCMNIEYKRSGYFRVGSSLQDTVSPGGYASSENHPKSINKKVARRSKKDIFQIIALPKSDANFVENTKGFHVWVVNKTDSVISLSAQDSRIDMIRQVFYNGFWQDIEYLPSSWCGNSYHKVYINPNEYWDFVAPCMEGSTEGNFRFTLYLDEDTVLYSNVFSGTFNPKQLIQEEGHTPNNLMDPYEN